MAQHDSKPFYLTASGYEKPIKTLTLVKTERNTLFKANARTDSDDNISKKDILHELGEAGFSLRKEDVEYLIRAGGKIFPGFKKRTPRNEHKITQATRN